MDISRDYLVRKLIVECGFQSTDGESLYLWGDNGQDEDPIDMPNLSEDLLFQVCKLQRCP
jgi:hypothetical protein